MPTRGLSKWQVGKETTWGTPVTATALLMGMQDSSYLQADNRSEIYPDIRGSLAPAYLAGLEQIAGKGEYEMIATFEDICYIFDGAFGDTSPTGTGPYVRAYTAPLTTAVTPRMMTWIYGNTQTGGGIYKLEGGLVNSFTLKGATGKPTMISGDLIGQTVTTGAFAALSDRVVEVIMGQPWNVYYDAVGGTIGTTALTVTAVAFELAVNCNRVLVWSLDSLTPDGYEQNPWDGTLKLTLRMNASAKTEVDAIVAQSAVYQKQVRLKQTSGTKIFQVDFAGTLKEPPKLYDDEDGVLTVELELDGTYNAALANWLAASVTNSVSALA
jgi:hypothetical protein